MSACQKRSLQMGTECLWMKPKGKQVLAGEPKTRPAHMNTIMPPYKLMLLDNLKINVFRSSDEPRSSATNEPELTGK